MVSILPKSLVYRVCQSLWHKYSHDGQRQATNVASLNGTWGRDVQNWLLRVGTGLLLCTTEFMCKGRESGNSTCVWGTLGWSDPLEHKEQVAGEGGMGTGMRQEKW